MTKHQVSYLLAAAFLLGNGVISEARLRKAPIDTLNLISGEENAFWANTLQQTVDSFAPVPPIDAPVAPVAPPTDIPVVAPSDAPVALTEAPVTDAPVTDAPVTDAPVTDSPTETGTGSSTTFTPTGSSTTFAPAGDVNITLAPFAPVPPPSSLPLAAPSTFVPTGSSTTFGPTGSSTTFGPTSSGTDGSTGSSTEAAQLEPPAVNSTAGAQLEPPADAAGAQLEP